MIKNRWLSLIAFSFCLLQMLGFGQSTPTRSVQWSLSTPLPEPRAGYAAGILNGKLIIAGGSYWEGTKGKWIRKLYTTSTHAFDPATERWEQLPDMPIALGYAASVEVGNRL
jgi:N-acetylneuraminic acid mutarotase